MIPLRPISGCLVCGRPLAYGAAEAEQACAFCGARERSAMSCERGHFVCDACHRAPALEAIERACLGAHETDMVELMARIRAHPAIAIHGPEHHAMVPGVILACCRNAGAAIDDAVIVRAIRRGGKHPGGACGYLGTCGAAVGLGAAVSAALDATPTDGPLRREAILAVAEALRRIGELSGARCCQRDSWVALQVAAEFAPRLLGVAPTASAPLDCRQAPLNAECSGVECPLHGA